MPTVVSSSRPWLSNSLRMRVTEAAPNGGASAALAETLGGAGAYLAVPEGTICLGLEINSNHLRPARRGWVIGRATPLHIGRSTQVWQIAIRDEQDKPICISRLMSALTSFT